jgi:hypothetical protein
LLFSNSDFYLEWKIRQELADPQNAIGRLGQHLQDDLKQGDYSDAQRIEKVLAEPTPILHGAAKEELYFQFFRIYQSAGRKDEAIKAATNVLESALLRNKQRVDRNKEAVPADLQRCEEVCKFLLSQNLSKQQFGQLNHVFTRCSQAFLGNQKLLYFPIILNMKTNDNFLNGEVGRAPTVLFLYEISAEHARGLKDGLLLRELIKRIDTMHAKYGQCKYYFLGHIAEGNYFVDQNDRASAEEQVKLLKAELNKKMVFSEAEMESYYSLLERLKH